VGSKSEGPYIHDENDAGPQSGRQIPDGQHLSRLEFTVDQAAANLQVHLFLERVSRNRRERRYMSFGWHSVGVTGLVAPVQFCQFQILHGRQSVLLELLPRLRVFHYLFE
jgi:hypothetical protein